MSKEELKDLRQFIAYRVKEGFESAHQIIENAYEYGYDKYPSGELKQEIKRITFELLKAHLQEQEAWEDSTDCDRLDRAFTSLNQQGIVARQDFACCNPCGFAEIWDEVEKEEKHRTVEGYVFYHLQCTEQAIKSGQLLMAYGSVEEDREQLNRVVNKVLEELKREGLNASWQGTLSHPITVDGIVWRKRRS